MEVENKDQSHVEEKQEVTETQQETPQPTETPKTQQPATDQKTDTTETPKSEKTYTEAEVTQFKAEQAAARQEAAQMRQQIAREALERQIRESQVAEAQAQAKDKQAIESGTITQDEATERAKLRTEAAQLKQQNAQIQEILKNQVAKGEANARIQVANSIGQEYGLDQKQIDILIKDLDIKDVLIMERKAAKMALKARDEQIRKASAKPEHFDPGPTGADDGVDESKLTGLQMARLAYKKK